MPGSARSLRATIEHAMKMLATADLESPAVEARTLIADALGVDVAQLDGLPDEIPPAVADSIVTLVSRRSEREPLPYILGRCRFRRLELWVDRRVLIPSEDSSPLVEVATRLGVGARVHDVGTGSGAIALAVKDERPDLVVSGSDVSFAAIEVARANAARLELDVAFSVAAGLPSGAYDLVVANLPYNDEVCKRSLTLQRLLMHQPHVAIFGGGGDGLDTIREFMRTAQPGVTVALQHDSSRSQAVAALLRDPETLGDAQGPKRFIVGRVP